jgi:hypothetical protein
VENVQDLARIVLLAASTRIGDRWNGSNIPAITVLWRMNLFFNEGICADFWRCDPVS